MYALGVDVAVSSLLGEKLRGEFPGPLGIRPRFIVYKFQHQRGAKVGATRQTGYKFVILIEIFQSSYENKKNKQPIQPQMNDKLFLNLSDRVEILSWPNSMQLSLTLSLKSLSIPKSQKARFWKGVAKLQASLAGAGLELHEGSL